MAHHTLEITAKHHTLLARLAEFIPDLDPEQPESLQRIFGLGLIALTMQVTNKARSEDQEELIEELGVLAREIVQEEGAW